MNEANACRMSTRREDEELCRWVARRFSDTAASPAAQIQAAPRPLRFAFAGRVSTEDLQSPEDSRLWQLRRARDIVRGRGEIVAEYFDIGQSRTVSWLRRPESTRLLDALANADRGFDAVVVGEPQRVFYDNQFGMIWPLFQHYRVGLWIPELGGPVDPDNEAHGMIMNVYAQLAKAERHRIQVRVFEAMRAQAQSEGRFLGGRPPYGYLLADAGPHPNSELARLGARRHRLESDPDAAPVVTEIFRMRAEGRSAKDIGRALDAMNIPCPSAHDRERNRHRKAVHWAAGAVLAILDNPRYLGHQVWGKAHRYDDLLDVDNLALGNTQRRQKVAVSSWTWSDGQAQPAIIDTALWQQAHSTPTIRTPRSSAHLYRLSGRLICAHCTHRMQGAWINDKAAYRCKHNPDDEAFEPGAPRTVYVREESILPHLPALLIRLGLQPDRAPAGRRDPTIDEAVNKLHDSGIRLTYDHIERMITATNERGDTVRIAMS